MQIFTPKTESFIKDHTPMSRDLVTAIIMQFSSELHFLTIYDKVATQNIDDTTVGFNDTELLVRFYHQNRDIILSFAKGVARANDYSSLAVMVQNFHALRDIYDVDDVAEGLHDINCDQHFAVAVQMSLWMGNELCRQYQAYMARVAAQTIELIA